MADVNNIKEDVARLKEWYSKQHHLPQNIDEHHYYNFVCGTNSLEKAKRKIDGYFSLRKKCMEMLTGVYPNTRTYRNNLHAFHSAMLPEKTADGYRVIISVAQKTDPANYNADAYFFRLLCLTELAFEMWPTDMDYVGFYDYQHLPLSPVKTLDITHTTALARLWSETLPMKMKALNFMNAPKFLLKVLPLLRTLVSKKINERIYVCQDDSKIKEVLPASMLPAEFGGQGKSMKEMSDYWTELIDSKASWFEEKLKLCTDESKRAKDSPWKADLDFGIEGSFKTLTID